MSTFFYDSYAIIEYIKDNPSYRTYFENHTGILTVLNILEVYYSVLSEAGKQKADEVVETLWPLVTYPTIETAKKAMIFRLNNKKKSLSYADCLGYEMAVEHGLKFLTGDMQFKGFDNVEFVK